MKSLGYFISIISVFLLGIVAWSSVAEKPLLAACLVLGVLTSVTGMGLRWLSYRRETPPEEREPIGG